MSNNQDKQKAAEAGQKLEQLARQMVLAEVNLRRAEAHLPPLPSLPESVWLLHGQDALLKAGTMKIVTIISLWSRLGRPAALVRYDVLAKDGDSDITLEDAYAVTNVDGRPMGQHACATTTGDLMILDGQHYLVEDTGFHALTEAEAKAIMQLSVLQTSSGYAWLVRNHLI